MSAKVLEVELDLSEMCLRCTIDTKCDQGAFSRQFRFKGVGWKLRYFKTIRSQYCNLYLHKCSSVVSSPLPFHVSVRVESSRNGSIVDVMPQARRFEEFGTCESIWERREDVVRRVVPEFRINGILKIIVFLNPEDEECTCATCKFTATDNIVPSLESFLKDLGDLLDQDESTDVELRCADADDNILATDRAHKILVCALSPALAAMLHSDMVEGRTGVATVKGIDAGVFKQFVKYLYSGKLDDETTLDTAMSLYEAGDRLQVKGLTKHCAKWMARNLTIERSCEVLLLADAHCDEELAEATVTFMANRELPHVFGGFKDFSSKHPRLAFRVVLRSYYLLLGMSTEGEYCCSWRREIVD